MDSSYQDGDLEMDAELIRALEEASMESGLPLSSTLYPSAHLWSGQSDFLLASRLKLWLSSTRRRQRRTSSLSAAAQQALLSEMSKLRLDNGQVESSEENEVISSAQRPNLKERLAKAVELDINLPSFTWGNLVSLHHSEHASSNKGTEDDTSKSLEVTVNSGGVVFFAIFKDKDITNAEEREAVAVLKFTSSNLVTQSERFGYELAKHMGVLCPQSRVIHKGSTEWEQLQKAVERCLEIATSSGDEDNKTTCTELSEALGLSQCVFLMSYVKGSPFLENQNSFKGQQAKSTASALARVFLLDLILRNEDRLVCSKLGWRGNPANLLSSNTKPLGLHNMGRLLSPSERANALNKKQKPINRGKFPSVDSLDGLQSCDSLLWRTTILNMEERKKIGFFLVTIDSGVPRRPPAGKRANDRICYPKVVELILNSTDYAADILYDISGGNFGYPSMENAPQSPRNESLTSEQILIIKSFQTGLREGIRDMQNLYLFLLKLYNMLQSVLHKFFQSITEMFPLEDDSQTDSPMSESRESPRQRFQKDISLPHKLHVDSEDIGQGASHTSGNLETSNKLLNGSPHRSSHGSPQLSRQLTKKLKSVNRTAKADPKLNEELKRWNDVLDSEICFFCQNHGFVTGFLEGGSSHSVIRNYELKVRLEHVIERMSLISQGADTERPSKILENLFIGGALAANAVHTLNHIGITHVLCLCSNELKSFEEEVNNTFVYKGIHVCDEGSADIKSAFKESHDFISDCEKSNGKCLVHCFEGRSRSATVVLSYLMLYKDMNLFQAWSLLKDNHRRAQPNDGFMQVLMDLERQLRGRNSMVWQRKKPTMQVCKICTKAVGLSISSLKKHYERSHPGISFSDKDSENTITCNSQIHNQ